MFQCVSELPPANRDTLAYLMVHLQKVAQSPACQMPITNLAKVLGPKIVGHRSSNPTHLEMFEDLKVQPKVSLLILYVNRFHRRGFLLFMPLNVAFIDSQYISDGQPVVYLLNFFRQFHSFDLHEAFLTFG